MAEAIHVRDRPLRPVMLYDSDCRFCCFWIKRWQRATGDRVEYIPYQDHDVTVRFSEIPQSRLEAAVHLVEPDGRVFSGAEAVFRSLATNPAHGWALKIYQTIPGAAWLSEWAYAFVARHRSFFSKLTKLFWSPKTAPELHR
jgi:predicted DCC family thiol-disulfide oxidoreductase YuxK